MPLRGSDAVRAWSFERAAAAQPHALFQVASLHGAGSGGSAKAPGDKREASPQLDYSRSLIRRASDAQRVLAGAVVEAQWAELGGHYGSQLISFSRPKVGHCLPSLKASAPPPPHVLAGRSFDRASCPAHTRPSWTTIAESSTGSWSMKPAAACTPIIHSAVGAREGRSGRSMVRQVVERHPSCITLISNQ